MTRPWMIAPTQSRPVREAIAAAIPVLETQRLRLRAPRLDDWELLEPVWTGPRAIHIGGPYSQEDAYYDFCQSAASWILRGFGGFSVTVKDNDKAIGSVGIFHDYGDEDHEAGWIMTEAGEGFGYATEAAQTVINFAHATLRLRNLVSYVDPANTASIRVATKLGAVVEEGRLVHHEDGSQSLVFRHPTPEAVQ